MAAARLSDIKFATVSQPSAALLFIRRPPEIPADIEISTPFKKLFEEITPSNSSAVFRAESRKKGVSKTNSSPPNLQR
jgi:hypothetical protein